MQVIEPKYKFNTTEKRIILLSALQINLEMTITISDFQNTFDTCLNSEHLNHVLVNMLERGYCLEYHIDANPNSWKGFNIITRLEYDAKSSSFKLEFNELFKPYLADLKEMIDLYSIALIMKLNNEYSLKLYHMFKQNSEDLKLTKKVTMPFTQVKERLNLSIKTQNENYYGDFSSFNRLILQPVLAEINDVTDINVVMEPAKTGRAITDLIFNIKSKKDK